MPSTTGGCDDQSSPPVTLFVADTASMLAPWRAALPQRTCTGPVSFGAGKRPSHPGSSLKLLARNLARSHQLGRAVTPRSSPGAAPRSSPRRRPAGACRPLRLVVAQTGSPPAARSALQASPPRVVPVGGDTASAG